MKANEAKRLKELKAQNARLKKLVANLALDIDVLEEISAETSNPECRACTELPLSRREGVDRR